MLPWFRRQAWGSSASGKTVPSGLVSSILNADDGAVTSNMGLIPTTNGSINSLASDSTNLILDISAYFAP